EREAGGGQLRRLDAHESSCRASAVDGRGRPDQGARPEPEHDVNSQDGGGGQQARVPEGQRDRTDLRESDHLHGNGEGEAVARWPETANDPEGSRGEQGRLETEHGET